MPLSRFRRWLAGFALAMAIGGGLGHILGGTLVDMATTRGAPALPWLVFAGVGGATVIGLALFYWRQTPPAAFRLIQRPG